MAKEGAGAKELIEKLVRLNRVSKAVKGGRKMSFSALTVVGNGKGRVGVGFGKANDVTEAVRKSVEKAGRNMITVPLKRDTIPHEITGRYKSASVLLKPATPGTGIIAGGPVRAVMEVLGVKDVLAKSLGSRNKMNVVRGVFNGLENLFDIKKISEERGKSFKELWGQKSDG